MVPENDPSTLFIIAGVHPIVPYILKGEHPQGKRLCNIQRAFRTIDIEEVGDSSHLTFLEMMGNWSLGDYFKKESLNWSMELLIEHFGLDPERIYVSVYGGDDNIKKDKESIQIWKNIFQKYSIKADEFVPDKENNEEARIFAVKGKDNFWGPAGQTGPCGPSSEIFYYISDKQPDFNRSRIGKNDHEYIEIWNNVFMQFNMDKDGNLNDLKQQTVDTGMGFERLCMIVQNRKKDGSIDKKVSLYDTDLFEESRAYLRALIEDESKKPAESKNKITEFNPSLTNLANIKQAVRSFRIIIDHLRAAVFLMGDGVLPSNKDQGYMLRRIIRRAIRHAKRLNIEQNFTKEMASIYIHKYKLQYPNLEKYEDKIISTIEKEEIKFEGVIERGSKQLDKVVGKGVNITGEVLFELYETYGYPIEIAIDNLDIEDKNRIKTIKNEFHKKEQEHKEESREGGKDKFKGGLADHSEITKRYHTATHLLLKALQIVLGDHVHQKGSNITKDRLRFDFSHDKKLTKEEIQEIEQIVNDQIKKELEVEMKTMPKEEALKINAEHEFDRRYPDKVHIYFIKNTKSDEVFSKEFCGGPHVENTSELAESGRFKIIKQKNIGSGLRRVKAVLK